MEYYTENNTRSEEVCVDDIMSLLYSMKRSKQNHALLTEYFLHEFAVNPSSLIDVIREIKRELSDTDNIFREKLARRYQHVFSFLCERFGLYEDKLELDDICFSITHPNEYTRLSSELEKYRKKSEKIIAVITKKFSELFGGYASNVSVTGRYKNIFSIHKKCEKKKIKDIMSLGDIFAFRIIIDGETDECFDIINILHDTFVPLPQRYKDYISIPKINGYQSLHTGLLGVSEELDIAIEVQIRTHIMDEIAESGIAAHFLYSTTKSAKMMSEKEQKLLHHLEEVAETIPQNPHIYCLSPAGDILRLSRGSSVHDFAYKIHSKLPKKARYALVNNDKKEMDYVMKNFDTVRIVTS